MTYWLVKTKADQIEIWTDSEQNDRRMKCEYYGAKPFWKSIMKIIPPKNNDQARVGEVIPYAQSTAGRHFAVILEFFLDRGQKKFKGIDLRTNEKIIALLA